MKFTTMMGLVAGGATLLATAAAPAGGGAECAGTAAVEPRVIDLAICLDTSGSMNGLIDAARQKLWAIVNDLALVEPAPRLRVALLTYGNDGHPEQDGWVRVDSGFTDDLDRISQQLFALSTNGGTEYVGRVLQRAARLDWHPSDDALKLIVVAGNESADQDPDAPFRDECRAVIQRGIMVNSIYCGPEADEIAPAWREVAQLADGQFAAIDQDQGTVVVATPFDQQLADLSTALNTTYLPMGAAGREGLDNQTLQDSNAGGLNSAAAAGRALTKSQSVYFCSWDLVDACRAGHVKLEEVSADQLPESMRDMTVEQRRAHVENMSKQRAEIQKQIAELSSRRNAFVADEMKKQAMDDSKSFDEAIRRAVREQAESKGFRFKPVAPVAEGGSGGSPS